MHHWQAKVPRMHVFSSCVTYVTGHYMVWRSHLLLTSHYCGYLGASLFKVKLRQTENISVESNSADEDDATEEEAVPTGDDAVWLSIHKSGIDVLQFPDFVCPKRLTNGG